MELAHLTQSNTLGHPLKRKKNEGGIEIEFPKDLPLARRVHEFSLNSFPKFRRLLLSGFQSWKEQGIGPVIRRSQSLPRFLQLHHIDQCDLTETHSFFVNLIDLQKSGHLNDVIAAYANLGLCYMETATAEVLSKVLAYREELENCSLTLPVHVDGQWEGVEYTIDTFTLGQELPVMVLTSDHPLAPTWVVPRGTSPFFGLRRGAVESIQADLQCPHGLDITPLENHQTILKEKLQGLRHPGKKIIFAGHSLGGVFALHMGLEAQPLENLEVEPVDLAIYTFNTPGVGPTTKALHDELDKMGLAPEIFQFMTEGDIIPSLGRFLLGRILAVELKGERNEAFLRPFGQHVCLNHNQGHRLREVDVLKEESSRCRFMMEKWVRACILRTAAKPFFYLAQSRLVTQYGLGPNIPAQNNEV